MEAKVTVNEVFAKHIFSASLASFGQERILSFLKNLPEDAWECFLGPREASSTKDLCILNKTGLLCEEIVLLCSSIATDYYNHEFEELSCIGSWGVRVKRGQHVGRHSHTNTYLCGCIYLEDDSLPTSFSDPEYSKLFSIFPPNKSNGRKSCSYSTCSLKTKAGSVLIWPSSISHSVNFNDSDKTRYSIAFNIAPKGLLDNALGSKLYINENK
tara:strand:- start:38 stop:676 length:639 start_codon:yes stop_codon:yes gene_type:complete